MQLLEHLGPHHYKLNWISIILARWLHIDTQQPETYSQAIIVLLDLFAFFASIAQPIATLYMIKRPGRLSHRLQSLVALCVIFNVARLLTIGDDQRPMSWLEILVIYLNAAFQITFVVHMSKTPFWWKLSPFVVVNILSVIVSTATAFSVLTAYEADDLRYLRNFSAVCAFSATMPWFHLALGNYDKELAARSRTSDNSEKTWLLRKLQFGTAAATVDADEKQVIGVTETVTMEV